MADDTRPFASAYQASDIPERVRRRFWSRVEVGAEDECWPCKLTPGNHGYGQMGWDCDGRHSGGLAHRIAWVLIECEGGEGCACRGMDPAPTYRHFRNDRQVWPPLPEDDVT